MSAQSCDSMTRHLRSLAKIRAPRGAASTGKRPLKGAVGILAVFCLGLSGLVPVSLAVASRAASAQSSCTVGVCGPASLLSPSQLQGNVCDPRLPTCQDSNIYAASDAQQAALGDLENQAVQNTLTDHGLPPTDAAAAQTWGRADALGELWQLMVTAMAAPACGAGETPGDNCRTADQQNAVDWLAAVDHRDATRAAEDAGLEYVKWAGLDPTAYQNLFSGSTFPDQTTITNFLNQGYATPGPQNYADAVSTCPPGDNCRTFNGQTYAEGFCAYAPPVPFGQDYSDQLNQTCLTPCTDPAGCTPFGPSYDQLVKWGAADVQNQFFDTPQYAQAVNDVAVGFGFGVGTAAAITALSLTGIVVGTSAIPAAGAAATALFPFAAVAGVTIASVAALALIAVAGAIAIGFYAVDTFNAMKVPTQLAQLMETAESTTPDLHSSATDSSALGGLFSLFMGASMPPPDASASCDSSNVLAGTRCLNAPSIPGESSNEQFQVSLNSGTASAPSLGAPVSAQTITWDDRVNQTVNTAYLSGNWFVVTPPGGAPNQTLRIHYTDWSGTGQTAWLVEWPQVGYRFITVADHDSSGSPPDPTTCLTGPSPSCGDSQSIDYIGIDGKEYSASAYSPLVQLGSMTFNPSSSNVEGSPVTLSVIGSTSGDGSPIAYNWFIEDKPLPSPTIGLCLNLQGQQVPCPPPTVSLAGNPVTYRFPTSGLFTVEVVGTNDAGSTSVTETIDIGDVAPQLPLDPNNTTVQAPGTTTTLAGWVAHAGSEDLETLSVNWGDGSTTDTANNSSCVVNTLTGQCFGNPAFGSPSPSLTSSLTYLPFTATHQYASPGVYTVSATVVDQAGAAATNQLQETVLYPTQTSLLSTDNPSVYGEPVTFRATVSSSGGSPTGTVTFKDGSTVLGTSTLDASDHASVTTSGLAVSGSNSHSITAVYGGDNTTFEASTSSTLTQTINQASTATTLSAMPDPTLWGQAVTFTAQVWVKPPGAGNPTGTVTFYDGQNLLGGCSQGSTLTNGLASCTTSALAVAGHSVTAVYMGDTNFTGSTSAASTQMVNKANTTTALSSSSGFSTARQPVTFTAAVSVTAPGGGVPTGTVTFYDGSTKLGTGPLNASAQATLQTSSLTVGAHSVTASYGGDGDFNTSATVTPLTQYINTSLNSFPKLPNGAYNLSNSNLSGDYFAGLALQGATLMGSNLTGAVFVLANLTGANLSNINFMSGSNFTNAILQNANLSNSNLAGANFTGVNLAGASLVGSNLKGASFPNAVLSGANLTNANLKGATGFKTATLASVIWSQTTCPDGTVSNQDGGTCTGHL